MVGISKVVEDKMGGTSGGLYAILLSALSKGLLQAATEQKSEVATNEVWARGLEVRFSYAALSSLSLTNPLTARPQHPLHLHPSPSPLAHLNRPPLLLHPNLLQLPFLPLLPLRRDLSRERCCRSNEGS
jgi:hypothetical protein